MGLLPSSSSANSSSNSSSSNTRTWRHCCEELKIRQECGQCHPHRLLQRLALRVLRGRPRHRHRAPLLDPRLPVLRLPRHLAPWARCANRRKARTPRTWPQLERTRGQAAGLPCVRQTCRLAVCRPCRHRRLRTEVPVAHLLAPRAATCGTEVAAATRRRGTSGTSPRAIVMRRWRRRCSRQAPDAAANPPCRHRRRCWRGDSKGDRLLAIRHRHH